MAKEIGIFIRKNFRWILLIICVIILFELIEDIFKQEIQNFDNNVYYMVSKIISNPMTYFMKILTALASAVVLCGICIISFLIFKENKYGIIMSVNLVTVVILNVGLKNVFDRPRPEGYRLIEETGYSFPSGHSMASMAFYGLIIYMILKNVKNQYIKWGTSAILLLLILGIGISRIYLGVHYASDVIGGFCFSIVYLACYTKIISNTIKSKKEKLDGAN